MHRSLGIALALAVLSLVAAPPGAAAKPEGTMTVAVATFGNERWLPHLYVAPRTWSSSPCTRISCRAIPRPET